MAKRKCLITGADGLIGAQLAQALQKDWEVHAIGRREINGSEPNIYRHVMDLSTNDFIKDLPATIHAVIYLAQSKYFREFPEKAEEIFQVNSGSVLRMLEYARIAKAKAFIFASSGGIYGNSTEAAAEDKMVPANGSLGFYLSSKLCSEIIAENYSPFMNIILLRFFFVYGPNQRETMLIPRLIKFVREDTPITLQGPDGISINPTHVDDAVAATLQAINIEGFHRINIAGPEVLSIRRIGEIIGKVFDKKPLFKEVTKVSDNDLIGDISKMRKLLVPPQVTFECGIKTLI